VRLLHHPSLPLIAALLAAVLALPSLFVGYQIDDFAHQMVIRELGPMEQSPYWGLFTFLDGDQERTRWLRDQGVMPWHAPLDLKVRLLRPVSAATHVLDDAVARDAPMFAHAQSMAWGALLVGLVALLFRRIEGRGAVAGLAALLYAVDEARAWPVAWLANRNALITGVFGVAVLLLFDRWRRDGWRPGAFLAPLVLAVGLFAGEAAIATTAWLFAYVLFLDDGPLRQRLARLMPYAVVVVAWRAAYSALGYGVANSGLYLDPMASPGAYLTALMWRVPALLADQLVSFPSMITAFLMPGALGVTIVAATALLVALGAATLPILRRSPHLGFWATGMLLSLLPVCATFPWNRLLTFVAIGGAPLIAIFLGHALGWNAADGPPTGRWTRVVAWALVVLHLGLAPLFLTLGTYLPKLAGDVTFRSCADAAPKGPEVPQQTFVYLNANDLCAGYTAFIRAVEGDPVPRRVFMLSSALYDVELVGIDERTVDLHVPDGLNSSPADTLLRATPMPVGETVELPDVTIEVLSHNEAGYPDNVRARFKVPLRDSSLVWIRSRPPLGEVFVPPAPGETLFAPAMGAYEDP
jgi:hypothetical protein